MTSGIEHTITGVMAMLAGIIGSKLSLVLAEAANPEHPWVSMLVGPVGALVGTVFGLWWMSRRLEKADQKAEKNEQILLDLVKQVTACAVNSTDAVRNSTLVIQRNNDYLDESNEILKSFK